MSEVRGLARQARTHTCDLFTWEKIMSHYDGKSCMEMSPNDLLAWWKEFLPPLREIGNQVIGNLSGLVGEALKDILASLWDRVIQYLVDTLNEYDSVEPGEEYEADLEKLCSLFCDPDAPLPSPGSPIEDWNLRPGVDIFHAAHVIKLIIERLLRLDPTFELARYFQALNQLLCILGCLT